MSDKSKRCVLFMTFRPSQRTLFMARRNWVPLALRFSSFLGSQLDIYCAYLMIRDHFAYLYPWYTKYIGCI